MIELAYCIILYYIYKNLKKKLKFMKGVYMF